MAASDGTIPIQDLLQAQKANFLADTAPRGPASPDQFTMNVGIPLRGDCLSSFYINERETQSEQRKRTTKLILRGLCGFARSKQPAAIPTPFFEYAGIHVCFPLVSLTPQ
jgi:hypothetical protein